MRRGPTTRSFGERLRQVAWIGRALPLNWRAEDSDQTEAGDTLVEVLIALLVLSFAALAMLIAFGAALSSSQEHRTLTNINLTETSVLRQITSELEDANPPLYQSCTPLSTYQPGGTSQVTFTNLPKGYSASITGLSYWDAAFVFTANQSACVANSPQLVQATVTYPTGGTTAVSAVIDDPTRPTPSTAGAATQLKFFTMPGGAQSGQNLSPQPVVEILDNSNNVVTTDLSTVTLTLNATNGASLSGCQGSENFGVVSFIGCSVALDGTYTITATDSSISGAQATSNPFTITPGPPSQLIFTQQPGGNITGGLAFPTQPQVTVEDAGGNVVTNDVSTLNLSITSGTGPGTLSGCTPTETSGVFTFSGCSINTKGNNYSLTATDVESSGTLTATSQTFNVIVGPAFQVAFTASPGSSTGGVAFGTQPVVAIEDAGGNTVTTGTGSTDSITIAIASGTGTLSCTNTGNLTRTTRNGVVNRFSGCSIALGTQGTFKLSATDNTRTLVVGTSTPFTVAGAASQLVFKTSPGTSSNAAVFASQPVVWIEDSSGNLVTNATNSVSLTINTGSGTLSCATNPVVGSGGVATFGNCQDHARRTGHVLPKGDGYGPFPGNKCHVHRRRRCLTAGLHPAADQLDRRYCLPAAAAGHHRRLVRECGGWECDGGHPRHRSLDRHRRRCTRLYEQHGHHQHWCRHVHRMRHKPGWQRITSSARNSVVTRGHECVLQHHGRPIRPAWL